MIVATEEKQETMNSDSYCEKIVVYISCLKNVQLLLFSFFSEAETRKSLYRETTNEYNQFSNTHIS